MLVTMVALRAVQCVAHADQTYRPNEAGEFEVEEAHVAELRAHGLVPKGEARAPVSENDDIARLRAENAQLRARLLKRGANQ